MLQAQVVASFEEVIAGFEARVAVIENVEYLSIRDFIMRFGKKSADTSNREWKKISQERKHELADDLRSYKFPGQGQTEQPVISFKGALKLIMWIEGRHAKNCRSAMAGILQRYCDGDQRLCEEVEENRRMGKRKSYEMFANNVIQNAEGKVAKKDHEMPTANYVYATKSPAFPGLIKIGKTIDVAKRLSSLNTSCAPAPHVIVAVAPYFDNQRDEETAHTFFASARREGEFFELEDEVVKNYFATHITSQYNLELAQHIARVQGLSV
jgi:hypothetical protein